MKRFRALLATAVLLGPAVAQAGTESVIYNFGGLPTDGAAPYDTLLWDSKGNLLGTTSGGGGMNLGTVFQISPPRGGGSSWSETGFFSLGPSIQTGQAPFAGLVFDSAQKHVFTTTITLGERKAGTVLELARKLARSGHATFSNLQVLHDFVAGPGDGGVPWAGVVFGPKRRLYGTAAEFGGVCPGCQGIVYDLVPPPPHQSNWVENIIYTFTGGSDGGVPHGAVVFDAAGNMYGTTTQGGNVNGCAPNAGCGTVYRLKPHGHGWIFTTLYTFQGSPDGAAPNAALILDAAGNLYGTAANGGGNGCLYGCGTVFELSPPQGGVGPWNETTLYSFTGVGDGGNPEGNAVFDGAGNLYVTASSNLNNTCPSACGTVLELSPTGGGGAWTPTILHSFTGTPDGQAPQGGLVLDGAGNLYGTTLIGGIGNFGTVFEVTP